VGDYVGKSAPARLVLLGNDQIADAQAVTLASNGNFELGAFSERLNALTMNVGPVSSSNVSSTTGTLYLGNGAASTVLTLNVVNGGRPTAATISGKLALRRRHHQRGCSHPAYQRQRGGGRPDHQRRHQRRGGRLDQDLDRGGWCWIRPNTYTGATSCKRW